MVVQIHRHGCGLNFTMAKPERSSSVCLCAEEMKWGVPTEEVDLNDEAGGPRYGHSATLIDMHPPR
jgi:hypothetical protein